MLGIAIGRIGMRYDDFCRLTPEEFSEVVKAYHDMDEETEKGKWERTRILAAVLLQPNTKKKIRPQDVIILPWDKKKRTQRLIPDKEESRRRFAELAKRYSG